MAIDHNKQNLNGRILDMESKEIISSMGDDDFYQRIPGNMNHEDVNIVKLISEKEGKSIEDAVDYFNTMMETVSEKDADITANQYGIGTAHAKLIMYKDGLFDSFRQFMKDHPTAEVDMDPLDIISALYNEKAGDWSDIITLTGLQNPKNKGLRAIIDYNPSLEEMGTTQSDVSSVMVSEINQGNLDVRQLLGIGYRDSPGRSKHYDEHRWEKAMNNQVYVSPKDMNLIGRN